MIPALRLTGADSMMTPDKFIDSREIRIMIMLAAAFLISSAALLVAIGFDTSPIADAKTS
jgi:hypothetical protein